MLGRLHGPLTGTSGSMTEARRPRRGVCLPRVLAQRRHVSGGPSSLAEQCVQLCVQFGLRLGPPLLTVVGPVHAAVE